MSFADAFSSTFNAVAGAKDRKKRRKLEEEMAEWRKSQIEDYLKNSELDRRVREHDLERTLRAEKAEKRRRNAGIVAELAGAALGKTGLGQLASSAGRALQGERGRHLGAAMAARALPPQPKELEVDLNYDASIDGPGMRTKVPLSRLAETREALEAQRSGGDDPLSFLGEDLASDEPGDVSAETRPGLLTRLAVASTGVGFGGKKKNEGPEPGAVVEQDGTRYRFKGGDPKDRKNWEPI